MENGLPMSQYKSSDSPRTFLLSPEMLLVLAPPTSLQKMSVCVELLCLRLRLFREWISDRCMRPLDFSDESRRLSKMFWPDVL